MLHACLLPTPTTSALPHPTLLLPPPCPISCYALLSAAPGVLSGTTTFACVFTYNSPHACHLLEENFPFSCIVTYTHYCLVFIAHTLLAHTTILNPLQNPLLLRGWTGGLGGGHAACCMLPLPGIPVTCRHLLRFTYLPTLQLDPHHPPLGLVPTPIPGTMLLVCALILITYHRYLPVPRTYLQHCSCLYTFSPTTTLFCHTRDLHIGWGRFAFLQAGLHACTHTGWPPFHLLI